MPTVDANGLSLHCRRLGSGPPVLLLAGMASDGASREVPMAALPNAPRARLELFATLARLRRASDETDWFRLLFQFLFSDAFFAEPGAFDAAVATAVGCPVHPIVGAADALARPDVNRAFHAMHGFAPPAVVDGAAHALHWERPEAVVGHLTEALTAGGAS